MGKKRGDRRTRMGERTNAPGRLVLMKKGRKRKRRKDRINEEWKEG